MPCLSRRHKKTKELSSPDNRNYHSSQVYNGSQKEYSSCFPRQATHTHTNTTYNSHVYGVNRGTTGRDVVYETNNVYDVNRVERKSRSNERQRQRSRSSSLEKKEKKGIFGFGKKSESSSDKEKRRGVRGKSVSSSSSDKEAKVGAIGVGGAIAGGGIAAGINRNRSRSSSEDSQKRKDKSIKDRFKQMLPGSSSSKIKTTETNQVDQIVNTTYVNTQTNQGHRVHEEGYRVHEEGGYRVNNEGGYRVNNEGGYRVNNQGGYRVHDQFRNQGGYRGDIVHDEFRDVVESDFKIRGITMPGVNIK